MRLQLGYPDNNAERELLKGRDRRDMLNEISPQLSADDLRSLQREVTQVRVADALLDYLQNLLDYSRSCGEYSSGLSPRSGLAVLHCARAWALLHDHDHVLPEDIQAVLPSVIGHRLRGLQDDSLESASTPAEDLIARVPIP